MLGILITGHEKGNIVVWHNIIQFYLAALVRALAQAQRTAANNNGATATTTVVSEKNSKKSKKDKVWTITGFQFNINCANRKTNNWADNILPMCFL